MRLPSFSRSHPWPACGLALLLVAAAASSPAQAAEFSLPADGLRAGIEWGSMSRPEPLPPLRQVALLLPVTLDGLDLPPGKRLLMQLDLGATRSMVYAPSWASIAARTGADAKATSLPRLGLRIGDTPVEVRDLEVLARAGKGIDWDSDAPVVIGTLGTDFIASRVITLDFREDRVALDATLPAALAGLRFEPFSVRGRRLLLPAQFEGQAIELMYDSGSSAFAWMTSEAEFERLATPGAERSRFPVRSWDQVLTAHVAPTEAQVQINGQHLPLREVSRVDGMGWLQRLAVSQLGAGGLVGNKLFQGRRLVIDMRAQRFALD